MLISFAAAWRIAKRQWMKGDVDGLRSVDVECSLCRHLE